MDKELVGWSHPEGSGQWLNVQMEISDESQNHRITESREW